MKRVILIGPLPPPQMGPTLATEVLLRSSLRERFEVIHLDTSDHRPLSTLGRLDVTNVYLALKSYVVLVALIIRYWPAGVYIPVSQTTVGYLRDSGYILIAKSFGRRVICHLRGGNFRRWFDSTTLPTRMWVRSVHALVDGQIVLGECLRIIFDGLVAQSKVFVVPNGKDIEFDPSADRDAGNLRVLYLANMRRTKGALDALAAVPLILRSCEDVEFVFAGGWSEPDVHDEFHQLLRANPDFPVSVMGSVVGDAKYELFSSADVFLFPSYYPPEGHPWVIVEALAAGLPIVATDQGAITESVLHGENGFIVEKRNPEAIAEKIVLLANDEQLRLRMGAASRRLYETEFTERSMVERFASAINLSLGNTGEAHI